MLASSRVVRKSRAMEPFRRELRRQVIETPSGIRLEYMVINVQRWGARRVCNGLQRPRFSSLVSVMR